ncbi:MAG: paraquat-inducible protein A [Methylococcales bacterium]|nr:paraquat-inducible protein A [Methylococcales bacterium]
MFTQMYSSRIDWRLILAAFLFLIAASQTYNLVQLLHTNQSYKTDLAEINHIRYGLLNADEWVTKTTAILEKKIDEYELNDQNKAELRQTVEHMIDQMIVQVDQIIQEKNRANDNTFLGWLTGRLKQFTTDLLIDIQGFRNQVPEFTDLLFEELNRPGSKTNIKHFLHEKLSEFAQNTFNPTDLSRYHAVLEKHGCADGAGCQIVLARNLENQNAQIAQQASGVLILFIFVFAVIMMRNHQPSREQILVLGLSCVVLLLGGILTPMIEIEARITELKFQLLGEAMIFENQVLYFQSKSITDVVSILTATGEVGMVLVGVLVSLFSIAFPIAKLLSSIFYYVDIGGLRYNLVIHFFALKSSKWAMADVMVVALFMAYIGFSGLIDSQLAHLQQASRYIEVMTTDGTSLQAGFFLFLGFCIASLILSSVLEKTVTINIQEGVSALKKGMSTNRLLDS